VNLGDLGMHLTQTTARYILTICQRMIIPERSLSLRTDLQRKKLVSNILKLYDGLKVFFIRSEGVWRHGK
jgi:hypothetical protein